VTCNAHDAAGNDAVPTHFDVFVELVVAGDTIPPVIAAHADIHVVSGDFRGKVVTYTRPTVTDNVDPPSLATCAPPSGTRFPLGRTRVTCSATDHAGNHAADTHFDVFVSLDVDAALQALEDDIDASSVAKGLKNELTAKIDTVQKERAKKDGKLKNQCTKLDGFLKQAREKAGKEGLTAAQSAIWVEWGEAISEAMGC
jgi:hypothetical protein